MELKNVVLAVMEMASSGGALTPDEAISHLAALINQLDLRDEDYEQDAKVLVGIGACIWKMQQGGAG